MFIFVSLLYCTGSSKEKHILMTFRLNPDFGERYIMPNIECIVIKNVIIKPKIFRFMQELKDLSFAHFRNIKLNYAIHLLKVR